MVGIVLVSHSHETAEGTAALARQMGGEDAALATAGGLDGPEHPIGTDAMRVLAAIEQVWSDDGVLVLMDLGSAVLSAEMALDFLDEERRTRVRLCDAPFVEGAVAGAVSARLGAPLADVEREARGGLAGKAAHLGMSAAAVQAAPEARFGEGPEVRATLGVDLPHGLHARPAARLVQTASAFAADVSVRNVTTGHGPVSAGSLNAVATLGVTRGDAIEVVARGPAATEAIAALRALAGRRFDEAPEDLVAAPAGAAASGASTTGGVLRGFAASPGVAVGPARRFHVPALAVPDEPAGTPEDERRALDEALAAAREAIVRQRDDAAARVGPGRAAIFDAHLLFLQDDALLGPAREAMARGASAPQAWSGSVEATAETWASLPDPYLRARAADLRSVGRTVLASLLGVEGPRPRLEAPGVLLAVDLEPGDTVGLDPATCLGIATAHGGPTSHASVLARALAIPAVVGLGETLEAVPEGATLGLDGEAGTVAIDPAPETIEALRDRAERRAAADAAARARATEPAATRDGVSVEVAANIGRVEEVAAAVAAGCDGVGLFRTEFLFMGRDAMPDEDEQEAAYRAAATALGGRPLLVRTLDAGADKPLPYLDQPPEPNPFLGVRGLRLGLARPDLLRTQLRALLRVGADHRVRIMFPMVATLAEVHAAKEALAEAAGSLGAAALPEVGVMIEVPSAALTSVHLAPEVDFFSIGTNDLTQYTLAADRGNEHVAALADPLHPAVLRLIGSTADAAASVGGWTGVCGELAADARATPLLLGLGVRELSMSAPAIAAVKQAVRDTDLAATRALAGRALDAVSGEEVRELLVEASVRRA
jgi:phosphoenolpyruvate-protein phosphotransferase/dihydroxyacetone kinase phosphotransfer subunit